MSVVLWEILPVNTASSSDQAKDRTLLILVVLSLCMSSVALLAVLVFRPRAIMVEKIVVLNEDDNPSIIIDAPANGIGRIRIRGIDGQWRDILASIP